MLVNKIISLLLIVLISLQSTVYAKKTRALNITKLKEIEILESLDISPLYMTADHKYKEIKNNIDQVKEIYFLKALKKGSIFMPNLHELLEDPDIPDIFLYMAMVESKFVATTKSNRNAAGLWQLMPATAKKFNLEMNSYIDERLDPIKSTQVAIEYLKYLHKRFGKWYLAALAYNCGETKLARVLNEQINHKLSYLIDDDLKLLPRETRNYMRRIIIAAMFAYDEEIIIKNNADHLFGNCTNSKLIEVFFNGGSTLENIALNVGMPIKKIKTCNPHLLKAKLPTSKKTYHVYLPQEYVKDLNNSEITIGRFTYKIKNGDTISIISKKFNIRINAIKRLNPQITNKLKIGQIITLIGSQEIAKN